MGRLVSTVLMVTTFAATNCSRHQPSVQPGVVEQQPRPQASVVRESARIDVVEVLYASSWPGWDVELLGVDANRAYLWLVSRDAGRVALDTVDLGAGQLIDRWEASPDNAAYWIANHGRFHPITGTGEETLARLATVLEHADPPGWGLQMIIVPDGRHLLYSIDPTDGRDGDWWMVADRSGRALHPFAPTLRASYELSFSPDVNRVAWSGYRPNPDDPAGYNLYLGTLDGNPVRVDAVRQPHGIVWSPDSRTVYAVAYNHPDRGCLWSVPVNAPRTARAVLCAPVADSNTQLVADPAGQTLVMATPRSRAGSNYDYRWIEIPDGALLSTHAVEGSSLEPVVLSGHRLVTRAGMGALVLLGLETGRQKRWDEEQLGGLVGWPRRVASPVGDHLLAIRSHRGSQAFEVVRLNLTFE